MAFSGAQITRLGVAGFPRPLYGSFAGKTETEAQTGAGRPARRRYTLPDGRRVLATPEEIGRILRIFRAEPERDIAAIALPETVETVEAGEETILTAPSVLFAPLMELAQEAGPELVMEITDDLTREEAIALGRMIDDREEEEAVITLLLMN